MWNFWPEFFQLKFWQKSVFLSNFAFYRKFSTIFFPNFRFWPSYFLSYLSEQSTSKYGANKYLGKISTSFKWSHCKFGCAYPTVAKSLRICRAHLSIADRLFSASISCDLIAKNVVYKSTVSVMVSSSNCSFRAFLFFDKRRFNKSYSSQNDCSTSASESPSAP